VQPRPTPRRRFTWLASTAGLVLVSIVWPVDAGELADPMARASYSLGHQIGADLVTQGHTVDTESLRKGLLDGLAGRPAALPADEMQALLADLKRSLTADERRNRSSGRATLRQAGAEYLATNARKQGVVVLPSGLQYREIHGGSGRQPTAQDSVEVRYRSRRLDDVVFHDSLSPDHPAETFRVSALIPGLVEALPLMREGARWQISIPPDLAFGRRGPLADQTVIYELELIAIVASASTSQGTDR